MDLIVYSDQIRLCDVNRHDPWEILSFVWGKKEKKNYLCCNGSKIDSDELESFLECSLAIEVNVEVFLTGVSLLMPRNKCVSYMS